MESIASGMSDRGGQSAAAAGRRARVTDADGPGPSALLFSRRALLVQVVCGAAPAMALLATGRVALAGYCFWAVLAVLAVQLVVRGRIDELLCLVVALMPLVNLLRDFATYNIVVMVLAGALTWFCVLAPQMAWRIWGRYWLAGALAVGAGLYYSISFLMTGQYAVNLRLFELSLTVLCLLLIGRHRVLLTGTLTGLGMATVLVGLAFLVQARLATAGRLGMMVIGDWVLGNPTQLGLPLALSLLAVTMDRGQWVNWSRAWRWGLGCAAFTLLALTTSRAAWAVAIVGVLVSLVFGSRQRLRMLVLLGIAAVGVQLLLLSPYGAAFQLGLSRTFGGEGTLAHRTSGRSDQWQVAYHAVTASPGAFIYGYGPGRGAEVYAQVSTEVPGVKYAVGEKVALHSLFMQVAVETGMVGLLLLAGWLSVGLIKVIRWTRQHRVVFPLICFLGYLVVVVTVSGNDTTSGTLLGIGLLATGRRSS